MASDDKILAAKKRWQEIAYGEGDEEYDEFMRDARTLADEACRRIDAEESELSFRDKLVAGIESVAELIDASYGVDGLHHNGDIAPWTEILAGGSFESWLCAFSEALAAVAKFQRKDA